MYIYAQALFSRYLFKSDRDSYDEMLGELKQNGEAEAEIAAIFTQACMCMCICMCMCMCICYRHAHVHML